jgi:hypothetical protein
MKWKKKVAKLESQDKGNQKAPPQKKSKEETQSSQGEFTPVGILGIPVVLY